MIKIYGVALSNYYNKVLLALRHKDVEFEEVVTAPSQEEAVVTHSPMGKIPYIEVDGQFITESNAIIEYLEAAYPDNANLFPQDLIAAAKCREVIYYIDMYIDAQSRRVLPAAFFGAAKDEALIDEVERNLSKNVAALQKLITFNPFINGDKITAADFSAITTLTLASRVLTQLGRVDPLANFEGLADYFEMMRSLPNIQQMEASNAAAVAHFFKQDS